MDGETLIYQSLIVTKELIKYLNINTTSSEPLFMDLRCFSTQRFPNGTIIYESSVNKLFTLPKSKLYKKPENITLTVSYWYFFEIVTLAI